MLEDLIMYLGFLIKELINGIINFCSLNTLYLRVASSWLILRTLRIFQLFIISLQQLLFDF